jgi:hypothetical protein
MNAEEYKYLEDTLAGRRGRDKNIEEKMSIRVEGKFAHQAKERRQQIAAKTATERELEQRAFSLKVYGRTHMEKFAKPITPGPYGELSVPGDQLRAHSATIGAEFGPNGRPVPPKGLKLQFHSAEPGCVMWKA